MEKQLQADFIKGLSMKPYSTCTPNTSRIRLSPPLDPSIKINLDEAIFQETGEAGIWVVVRNPQGLVMVSMAKKIILPHSVADVEAKAAVTALRFAQELNFSSIILEGDAKVIIKTLCSEDDTTKHAGL